MYKLVAAMAVLALIAVPVTAEEAEDESILGIGGLYLADNGLYEETNEVEGLQREAGEKDDEPFEADTAILAL